MVIVFVNFGRYPLSAPTLGATTGHSKQCIVRVIRENLAPFQKGGKGEMKRSCELQPNQQHPVNVSCGSR